MLGCLISIVKWPSRAQTQELHVLDRAEVILPLGLAYLLAVDLQGLKALQTLEFLLISEFPWGAPKLEGF